MSYTAFADLMQRALLEIGRRKLSRLEGDHSHAFFDQLFDPGRPPDVSFRQLADQYLQITIEEAHVNGTSQKWIDKQRASIALLREIIGDETPVTEVNYDACLKVRSVLSRLPANRSKLYSGLALEDAIARAGAEDKPLLSSVTQDGYLATLRDLLELAEKKRLIGVNPAAGLKPMKRDGVAAAGKREPFTLPQIKQFFKCEFYRRCSKHSPPYAHDKDGWRFWLPLMCLLMGMRPNEACQLSNHDVRRTAAGTWFVDVVASDDEEGEKGKTSKTLKTASSRRRVPLHPELIKIGFLTFVDERRQAGSGKRLFPRLKPDGYGNHATYALKRFRDKYLPEAIELKPRQSFYSFRHSFRDELRRISAPPEALQALGGWSQGKLTSDAYGDAANPDHQVKFMHQVAFPGLDLSHLHFNTPNP